MSFKKAVHLFYGLFLGTSVRYFKSSKRILYPTREQKISNEFSIFRGGSGNCGVFTKGDKALLINCNQGRPAEDLRAILRGFQVEKIIVTSEHANYGGGWKEFPEAQILAPENTHKLFTGAGSVDVITQETTFEFGGETFILTPVDKAYNGRDLVVTLKSRSYTFWGGLFYHKIHPPLLEGRSFNIDRWIEAVQTIYNSYRSHFHVPHEGDVANAEQLKDFLEYLRVLEDTKVPFSYCRENFDWSEITGYTSLEENFDYVRSGQTKILM